MGITMVQYPVGSMSACGLVEGFLRRKNQTQVMLFQIVYGTPNPNFFLFIKDFLFVYTGTGIFLLQVCKTTIIWSLEISCLPKYSGAGPFLVNSELWLRRQVYK